MTKVVVSSVGDSLDAQVSPVFGRCAYLLFVDTDTMALQTFANPAVGLSGGAGIRAAQFAMDQGAQAVLTSNVGPNAMAVFQAAGVPVYPVWEGTVRQAVEAFQQGKLETINEATTPVDTGKMGATGSLPPSGAGMGRGMGQGRGRGLGRSRGGAGRGGGFGGGRS